MSLARSTSSRSVEPEQLDVRRVARAALGMPAGGEDAAAERREQAGQLDADAAVADDPDRQLGQLAAAQRLPRPLALELQQLRQPPGDRQRHHHHVLGDRPAEDAARVRHQSGRARGPTGVVTRSTPADAEWIQRRRDDRVTT